MALNAEIGDASRINKMMSSHSKQKTGIDVTLQEC